MKNNQNKLIRSININAFKQRTLILSPFERSTFFLYKRTAYTLNNQWDT